MEGQINISEWQETIHQTYSWTCRDCICKRCLYWWSSRCQYGECYDDLRARENPYDKAHPGKPPRDGWSNWNKPGEQAHWCRGGTFYITSQCDHYVRYQGQTVEHCVYEAISIFQDGYIGCGTKERIGCDACISGRMQSNTYSCPSMTETGCDQHMADLRRMADDIVAGKPIEMCKEQCCIGCSKNCDYRCGKG